MASRFHQYSHSLRGEAANELQTIAEEKHLNFEVNGT
jgi:hypothetical protein